MDDSVAEITSACYHSKVAQSLHWKQLSFHYLLDLEKTNKTKKG